MDPRIYSREICRFPDNDYRDRFGAAKVGESLRSSKFWDD